MKFNKCAFVIVDAYTTGRFLAPLINSHGYTCIHVQSSEHIIPAYMPTFILNNFQENIIYNNIEAIIDRLSAFDIKGVIPGSETGVILADQLSWALGLFSTNGVDTSILRRNKFEMARCLAKNNIKHIKSYKSSDINEIIQWVSNNEQYPVVIKPLSGSGTHGVKVCANLADLRTSFNSTINSENVFNDLNTELLVQRFLVGQEYVVNTVSVDGKHKIVDVWRKYKNIVNGIPINDYSEILDGQDDVYPILTKYIFDVLDALSIKFGAGHSEIMLTEGVPILIETAARLAGSIDPSAVNESIGTNQVSCLIESYIDPENFYRIYCDKYRLKKYARHIFFSSSYEGQILNDPDLQYIINLPSFHSISFKFNKGDTLVKTTSLADFPGFLYLVSTSKEQVEKDCQAFREYESILYERMCN